MLNLNMVGLVPGEKRHYSWIGDPACDRARSDAEEWLRTGSGLVPVEGQKLTVFVCETLRPSTFDIAKNHALGNEHIVPTSAPLDVGVMVHKNWPAVQRALISYAISEVENGAPLARIHDAGGSRLTDEVLDRLEFLLKPVEINGRKVVFFEHLGELLFADNQRGQDEGKG